MQARQQMAQGGDPDPENGPGQQFDIGRLHNGFSLYDFLDAVAGPLDRRVVQAASRAQQLVLNDEPVGPSVTLRVGDVVDVLIPIETLTRGPRNELPILHRGDEWLVTSKASGVLFDASGRGGSDDPATVLGRLRGPAGERPRPAHRLDKATSGIVVVALTKDRAAELAEAFADRRARVEYMAIVRSAPEDDAGLIDVPLGKRNRNDPTLHPDPGHGTPCETAWRVIERLRGFTVVQLTPRGGRSHQVRGHLAAWGFPALCDRLYGEDDRLLLSQLKIDYRPKRGRPERPLLARPALHATRFLLDDLVVEAPPASDLEVALTQLRRLRPLTGADATD